MAAYNYAHIAANGAVSLAKAPVLLANVCVNGLGATGNTLTLTDDAGSGTGPVIAVINTTSAIGALNYNVQCKVGLTATMAGGTAGDTTVCFG